ncbi:MAG: septum formation inhibitor Maf [Oxalobacter sp.]|jgi:septum formation protein|nr:MAG: septum formation inhibitor Maf [Oxalobacter sp.]
MATLKQRIYLASGSPRRRELLRQIGVDFSLLLLNDKGSRGLGVNEDVLAGESPQDYVARVTREKATVGHNIMLARRLPVLPILAADTTVTIDDKILGKPANRDEAVQILRQLSGRTHQVLTAIAIKHREKIWQTTQISEVSFASLTDEQIQNYCATPEPFDKAGGYGIQGLAAVFISHIAGSYSSIMGLPLYETAQLLQQAGIKTL